MDKDRLDVLLVKTRQFSSREKARIAILAGAVYIDGKKEEKPAQKVAQDSFIEIRENVHPYVGRGGLKLAKAIEVFKIDLNEKVCMDIGASTGGFTDCMLQNGANTVYAVDVGSDQLASSLREDSRVISFENTDIRNLKITDFNVIASFCTIDVSFISLKKILPHVKTLLKGPYEIVCLVKPQFEAGRSKVGKNGIVKDKKTHIEVLTELTNFCFDIGLNINGIDFSPIKGSEGNIEYLLYLSTKESGIKRDECSNILKRSVFEAFLL